MKPSAQDHAFSLPERQAAHRAALAGRAFEDCWGQPAAATVEPASGA